MTTTVLRVNVQRPTLRIKTGTIPSSSGGSGSLDGDLNALAGLSGTGVARRTGVDTWTLDTGLASLADGDTSANLLPSTSGANQWAYTPISNLGRTLVAQETAASMLGSVLGVSNFAQTLLDDADAETARATLGLPVRVVLNSNRSTTSTSLSDVTGLSFTLSGAARVYIKMVLLWQTAATTTGIGLALTAPTTDIFALRASIPQSTDATTSVYFGTMNSNDDTVINGIALAADTPFPVIVEGVISTTASGTVQLRFRSEVNLSAVTLLSGSFLEYLVY